MNRKRFLQTTGLALAGAVLPISLEGHSIKPKRVKPPRLKKGDTIALVAPAGEVKDEQIQDSFKNLEALGFVCKEGKHIREKYGYLAGEDKKRAEDLTEQFLDRNVAGIMAIRGGYGCSRMLDYIDYSIPAKNPKVFMGYSDLTALHYALYTQSGLVSFHGPVSTSTFNDYSVQNFINTVMEPTKTLKLECAVEEETGNEYIIKHLKFGKARGILMGGNLSVAVSLIGTRYISDATNALYYFEEIGEEPYRIDRMLQQFIMSGALNGVRGVLHGVYRDCDSNEKKSGIGNSFSLNEVLQEKANLLNVPSLYGFSFGHIKNKITLPFGVEAELKVESATLTLLESAVL